MSDGDDGRAVLSPVDHAVVHAVVHDLRNTLGLVVTYADLALEGVEDRSDIRAYIVEMRAAGRSAAGLLDDLSMALSDE